MNRIKYRSDIDGLRAIAVLSVVFYHAFPSRLTGGFIGVDIFFVISGFLISKIIINNKNFNYKEFYVRRVKRLFPALIVVVFFNLFIGWYILFPDEFKQLGKHIISGLGFVSNIVLWDEVGYFDRASSEKTLLHLWSLAVEEQFYIFWPISLVFFHKKMLNIPFIIIFIGVLSFSIGIYSLYYLDSYSAFYLSFNRFWELMIGGFLASTVDITRNDNKTCMYKSILGVLFIGASYILIDKHSYFPGFWALLPTLGAFFIISSENSLINRYLLSNRMLVYIGLISYPFYLWHWSILSFAHIMDYTSRIDRIIAIILSILLSIFTYEFIEKKIKKIKHIVISLITISIIFSLLASGIFFGLISPRNNSTGVSKLVKAVGDWEYPQGLHPININGHTAYYIGDSKSKVLFYGDSHMEQYSPRVVNLISKFPNKYKSVVFATRGGCPPIPNVFEDKHSSCNKSFKDAIKKFALSKIVDSVVISFSSNYFNNDNNYYYRYNNNKLYFHEEELGRNLAIKDFNELVIKISQLKNVYLIADTPKGKLFNPRNFFSGSRIKGLYAKKHISNYQVYSYKSDFFRENFLKLANNNKNIYFVDSLKHLCKDGKCLAVMDKQPIYKDSGHLRPFYVRNYIGYIDHILGDLYQ